MTEPTGSEPTGPERGVQIILDAAVAQAIAIHEALGAIPELGKTYFEVGEGSLIVVAPTEDTQPLTAIQTYFSGRGPSHILGINEVSCDSPFYAVNMSVARSVDGVALEFNGPSETVAVYEDGTAKATRRWQLSVPGARIPDFDISIVDSQPDTDDSKATPSGIHGTQ